MSKGAWCLAAGVGLAMCISVGASAHDQHGEMDDDVRVVAEARHGTMNSLGQSMRTLNRFAIQGRGSSEDALEAVAVIAAAADRIPSLFPPGTGADAIPKSESKDNIWTEWDSFVAAAQRLGTKAALLEAAIGAGDSDGMAEAFEELGKIGCGGCHDQFREKRS